jgi:DNA-binding protein HU-beta
LTGNRRFVIAVTGKRFVVVGPQAHMPGEFHPTTIFRGEVYTMTKAELIDKMAADAEISKMAAGKALDAFMDGVTKALKKKEGKVTLVGFGTFAKAHRKARTGRNPQTGKPIKIKACNVVKFRPGKKLRDDV